MSTQNYGKIDYVYRTRGSYTQEIPFNFISSTRWLCQCFQSHSMGNGNWGSEIIVFVDNFGETYHFSEYNNGGNYNNSRRITYLNKQYRQEAFEFNNRYPSFEPKEQNDFALTDDFIDILKSSPNPDIFIKREQIDSFINIVVEKNKKLFELYTEKNPKLEEENLNTIVPKRETILSAIEERIQKESMRGFINVTSAENFRKSINNHSNQTEEDKRIERISHSWAYES